MVGLSGRRIKRDAWMATGVERARGSRLEREHDQGLLGRQGPEVPFKPQVLIAHTHQLTYNTYILSTVLSVFT